MPNPHLDAVVRAYDLGGYGDIAGAMRVASYLQRIGIETAIQPTSLGALEKLTVLNPDVLLSDRPEKDTIQIDVAGHYKDDRNSKSITPTISDIPHHFTEDMDNPAQRKEAVPLYMKTGLSIAQPPTLFYVNHPKQKPLFYRPYREWEFEERSVRDARLELLLAMLEKREGRIRSLLAWSQKQKLGRILEGIDKVGFAHLSPEIQVNGPETILEHPYFAAIFTAKMHYTEKFGIGLFVNQETEKRLTKTALRKNWGAISSAGEVVRYDPDFPTLIFLGPQSQRTTANLFLSADIPNLVTGDLSLSDALYALIAMDGQSFFYEVPRWKVPTYKELTNILLRHDESSNGYSAAAPTFAAGSCPYPYSSGLSKNDREALHSGFQDVVNVLGDEKATKAYTEAMRHAVREEIRSRFGDVPVEAVGKDGFSIPPGTPYLIQDATANIVNLLQNDPAFFAEVEKLRQEIAHTQDLYSQAYSFYEGKLYKVFFKIGCTQK